QHDHLAVLEGNKAVVEIGGGDRDVCTQTQGVVLVYPGVIAGFDAPVFETFETRSGILVELPSFGAVIAGCLRTVERAFAQAAVEADKVSARFRTPGDAICIDVAAADADAGFWHGEELRKLRLRIETQETGLAAEHADRVPDRAVFRIGHDGVRAGAAGDACVLSRFSRLARLGVLVTLAVPVGVEDERRPTNGFLRIVRLV